MSTHKNFDRICCIVLAVTIVITVLFMCGEKIGITSTAKAMGYETRLFDTSKVHTINIVIDDWDGFLETCTSEEYTACSVVIDNEAYKNVAIRAKGNTSLTQVQSYGNNRYSFKIEFDHYDSTKTYYGLDKLCLNNIIQDNTYMKDYLCYRMMSEFGVDSPLCSYVYITVNGEDWGLYLAVEGIEDSFLQRNYGNDSGELYKPDSQSMGGGRGNGGNFRMSEFNAEQNGQSDSSTDGTQSATNGQTQGTPPSKPDGSSDSAQQTTDGQTNSSTDSTQSAANGQTQGTPPSKPDGSSDSAQQTTDSQTNSSTDSTQSATNGQTQGTPPSKPDGSSDSAQQTTDGQTNSSTDSTQSAANGQTQGTPPSKPDGSSDSAQQTTDSQTNSSTDSTQSATNGQTQGTPPSKPDGSSDSAQQTTDGQTNSSTDSTQSATNGQAQGNPPSKPDGEPGENGGGMDGGMNGSDDVSLIYSDDEYSSYQNIFDNAKTDITDSDKDRLIASLKKLNNNEDISDVVDVDEVIRYFVVHNFVCNFDSYTGSMIHNYYLYEKDGQMSMIPWDYNLAFGGFMGAQNASALVNYPIDTPVSGGTVDSRPMLAWIFASDEYTEEYHELFSEFIEKYFDSDYIPNLIDSTKEMIAEYVEKDPTKFCTYEEFESGVTALKEFCTLRAESISGQLDGTIPSTSDGQSADSSSLIKADDLNISDMGTMNNNNGGGSPDGKAQNNTAQTQSATDSTNTTNDKSFSQTPPNNSEGSSDGTDSSASSDSSVPTGGFGGTPPDMSSSDSGDPPSMPNGEMPSMADGEMPSMPDGDMQGNSQGDNSSEKDSNGQNEKAPSQSGEASGETAQTLDKNSIIILAACAGVLILGVALAFVYKKKS